MHARLSFTDADAAAMRRENSRYPFDFTRDPITFQASLSIPIFNGFQREQRVQEADANRTDARYAVRTQELRVRQEIHSGYRNLMTAYEAVQIQTRELGRRSRGAGTGSGAVPRRRQYVRRPRAGPRRLPARGERPHHSDLRIPPGLRYARERRRPSLALGIEEEMSKKVKWSIGGVVIVGIAAFMAVTAAKRGNKGTEVRIEAVEKRDLVASVTASGQVQPQTKVDVAADITRPHRPARGEGRRSGHEGPVPARDRSVAVHRARCSAPKPPLRASQAQAAQAQAEPHSGAAQLPALCGASRKRTRQLVSDEQLEQLKTQVEVQQALQEAATAPGRAVGRHQLRDAQQQPREDHDLRADERPRDAARRRGGRDGDTGHVQQGRGHAAHDQRHERARDEGEGRRDRRRAHRGRRLGGRADRRVPRHDVPRPRHEDLEQLREGGVGVGGLLADQAIDYEVTIQLVNPPKDTRPDFSATAKIVTDTRAQSRCRFRSSRSRCVRTRSWRTPTPARSRSDGDEREAGRQAGRRGRLRRRRGQQSDLPARKGWDRRREVLRGPHGLKEGEKIVGGTYQAIRELKDGALVREPKKDDKKPQVTKS